MTNVKKINESALRPADAINVGDITPVSLDADPIQAANPYPVEPYLADVTGAVPAEPTLDAKEFINTPPVASIGNDITSVDDITARINGVVTEDANKILDTVMGKLIAESLFEVKLKDQLGSLFESHGLNEDFSNTASSLFEAAVTTASKAHLQKLNESAERYITEQLDLYSQATQNQVNAYLQQSMNEWVEENRPQLELGARTRIAESFMDGLKSLLESHYIELPANRVDLYEAACTKGDEILNELEEEKNKCAKLEESVKELSKKLIVESSLSNLTAIKADKVRTLAESIDFVNETSFKTRLNALVESFNTNKNSVVSEPVNTLSESVSATVKPISIEVGKLYADALNKFK